jgi:hypothetical protein
MPRYKWRNSVAKAIIVSDLQAGILDVDTPTARDAWDDVYNRMADFKDVTFKQFPSNLGAENRRYLKNRERYMKEEFLMHRDRQIHPRSEFNSRGEPVFDLHPAKLELRENVKLSAYASKLRGFRKNQV